MITWRCNWDDYLRVYPRWLPEGVPEMITWECTRDGYLRVYLRWFAEGLPDIVTRGFAWHSYPRGLPDMVTWGCTPDGYLRVYPTWLPEGLSEIVTSIIWSLTWILPSLWAAPLGVIVLINIPSFSNPASAPTPIPKHLTHINSKAGANIIPPLSIRISSNIC